MDPASAGSTLPSVLELKNKSIKNLTAARFTVLQRLCLNTCRPDVLRLQLVMSKMDCTQLKETMSSLFLWNMSEVSSLLIGDR